MNLIETGDQQINADRDPDLGAHCVFAWPVERFYAKVLLYPFEEQFNLPSAFIDRRNCQRRQIEVVSEEDCRFPVFVSKKLIRLNFIG